MKQKIVVFLVLFMFCLMTRTPTVQAAPLLKIGSQGSEVLTLQANLKAIGVDPGPLDGIYGTKTKAAVQAFQRSVNLQADGIYGPLTEKALNQSLQKLKNQASSQSRSVTLSAERSAKTEQVLATAKKYLGVPYLWGGTSPSGFDCSGFTQYVFAQNGISLSRVSRDQYTDGTSVAWSDLKPGDLVFFSFLSDGKVSHVGIYLGESQFISATTSKGVTISSFSPYWKNAYVGAKRVY